MVFPLLPGTRTPQYFSWPVLLLHPVRAIEKKRPTRRAANIKPWLFIYMRLTPVSPVAPPP